MQTCSTQIKEPLRNNSPSTSREAVDKQILMPHLPPHQFRHPDGLWLQELELEPYSLGERKKFVKKKKKKRGNIWSRKGRKCSSRAPKGSRPYLDKDELAPQRHGIRELLSEAQHDSAVWEVALVVVKLQLCKEKGTVRRCQTSLHSFRNKHPAGGKAVGSGDASSDVQSLQPGGIC